MQEKRVLEDRRIVLRMDERREELKARLRRNRRKSGACASVGCGNDVRPCANRHAEGHSKQHGRRGVKHGMSRASAGVSGIIGKTSMPSRPHAMRPGSGRWNNGQRPRLPRTIGAAVPSTIVVSVSKRVRMRSIAKACDSVCWRRPASNGSSKRPGRHDGARLSARRSQDSKRRAPVTMTGKAKGSSSWKKSIRNACRHSAARAVEGFRSASMGPVRLVQAVSESFSHDPRRQFGMAKRCFRVQGTGVPTPCLKPTHPVE